MNFRWGLLPIHIIPPATHPSTSLYEMKHVLLLHDRNEWSKMHTKWEENFWRSFFCFFEEGIRMWALVPKLLTMDLCLYLKILFLKKQGRIGRRIMHTRLEQPKGCFVLELEMQLLICSEANLRKKVWLIPCLFFYHKLPVCPCCMFVHSQLKMPDAVYGGELRIPIFNSIPLHYRT